ncbi:MAG TPA: RagB/SusD family nutrient uptake outer membrane protein [Puia sp.]
MEKDVNKWPSLSVQSGAAFKKGTNEYFPIPQQEIILDPKLKQNAGY